MRELVISRPLDPSGPFESVLLDHPSLTAQTLAVNIASGQQVSLVAIAGTPSGLKAIRARYVDDPPPYVSALEVVRAGRNDLLLLISIRTAEHPLDIAGLVESVLGPETLVSFRYDTQGVRWRVVTLREDRIETLLQRIGARYNAVEQSLERAIPRFKIVSYLREPRLEEPGSALSSTPRRVWELALSMGYYERPRGCTLDELAERAGLPRSTTHYHLREAERIIHTELAKLVT